MSLEVSIRASFEATGAVAFEIDIDLVVEPDETLVVLGPSGSGKTLLLETIAGYHDHEGTVRSNGRDLTAEPPEARGFGFVFQNYALFPHMTVRENVAFGTRYHTGARDPDDVLGELGIFHLADRTPTTLSGGEAQRVALARSLAIRPSTLLLDEPLSALDVPTRKSLRTDLAALMEDRTAIYVTHNRTTARELADRIAVLREGRTVQVGTREAVFERPATPFVARFTGSNCVPAATWSGAVDPRCDRLDAVIESPGEDGFLSIRPEHVIVGDGGAKATVERATRGDFGVRVTFLRDDSVVEAYMTTPPAVGSETTVRFPRNRVTRFAGFQDEPGTHVDQSIR